MLLAIAVLAGPSLAYASPFGGPGADASQRASISFSPGPDYATARQEGLVNGVLIEEGAPSYALHLQAPAYAKIVIDDLVRIETRNVQSWGLSVDASAVGLVGQPSTFKLRLWTGPNAPSSDDDPNVCQTVDLLVEGRDASPCAGDAKAQLVAQFQSAKGAGVALVRPVLVSNHA